MLIVLVWLFLFIVAVIFISVIDKWVESLKTLLKNGIVVKSKDFSALRSHTYAPTEKANLLDKDKLAALTVIDRGQNNIGIRNRLSEAELERVEQLFKDVFALEMYQRFQQLADGKTRLFKPFCQHDLLGLALSTLLTLLFCFVCVLFFFSAVI